MDYAEAIKRLNAAAYDAIRACKDTTRYPYIDRHALRKICTETDRLVDQGEYSGAPEYRQKGGDA